jgi:hypothetical protein
MSYGCPTQSYRALESEMRELQRCSCGSCSDRYSQLEYQYRYRYDSYRKIVASAPFAMAYDAGKNTTTAIVNAALVATGKPEEKKLEKPITNPAIKLLADRLKAVDSSCASAQASIDSYKKSLGQVGTQLEGYNNEKSALEKALKKLGHKIAQ